MARKRKKATKAAQAASAALKGSATTPEPVVTTSIPRARSARTSGSAGNRAPSFLDRTVFSSRITMRAVLLFFGLCVVLDIGLWALFEFGFGRCYGLLCLL